MGQLQERLQKDLANLPYGGPAPRTRELLKILLSEIKLKKGNEPSDEDVLAVIRKFKENAIECDNLYEVLVLNEYLPKMLGKQEMDFLVKCIISDNDLSKPSDLGKVMKELGTYGPTIDKKYCSTIAKQLLTQ
jgi:hypothetical protein